MSSVCVCNKSIMCYEPYFITWKHSVIFYFNIDTEKSTTIAAVWAPKKCSMYKPNQYQARYKQYARALITV